MELTLQTETMNQQGREQLITFLEETPVIIRALAVGLTDPELRRKPSAGEFSVLEHVCHLNDIEREAYAPRITRLLNENNPFLPDVDGDKLARERNYQERNFDEALRAFTDARNENLSVVKKLSPEQLKREGVFEAIGPITLEGLLLKMREHDESHREEMRKLVYRLG